MSDSTWLHPGLLCGVVLAGGDGIRLRDYVLGLKGKDLPKQYVNVIGKRSLLEHTLDRAERLITSERLLTVVGRRHLAYPEVLRQLCSRPPGTVIVQPRNRDTGPGVLLPLAYLSKQRAETIVALFPSDHFVLEEDRFMSYVGRAAEAVRSDPSKILLLAVPAREPETDYGYIVPGAAATKFSRFGIRTVAGFIEKPGLNSAIDLVQSGGLWNTMAMVFERGTLMDLVRIVQPALYDLFRRIIGAIDTPNQPSTIETVYRRLEPVNFSKGIIERIAARCPGSVAVLPVENVFWSDWGSPQRIIRVIEALQKGGRVNIQKQVCPTMPTTMPIFERKEEHS